MPVLVALGAQASAAATTKHIARRRSRQLRCPTVAAAGDVGRIENKDGKLDVAAMKAAYRESASSPAPAAPVAKPTKPSAMVAAAEAAEVVLPPEDLVRLQYASNDDEEEEESFMSGMDIEGTDEEIKDFVPFGANNLAVLLATKQYAEAYEAGLEPSQVIANALGRAPSVAFDPLRTHTHTHTHTHTSSFLSQLLLLGLTVRERGYMGPPCSGRQVSRQPDPRAARLQREGARQARAERQATARRVARSHAVVQKRSACVQQGNVRRLGEVDGGGVGRDGSAVHAGREDPDPDGAGRVGTFISRLLGSFVI
jgi:hypothetical protein